MYVCAYHKTTVLNIGPCMLYPYILFVQVAFSENFDRQESKVGEVALYENGEPLPNARGIVVLCIEVEEPPAGISEYQKAAVCWNGDSTFNEGAAAATCRQLSYSTQMDYGPGNKTQ